MESALVPRLVATDPVADLRFDLPTVAYMGAFPSAVGVAEPLTKLIWS